MKDAASGTVRLPADHPLRRRLADEVHARPPVPTEVPAAVSCIALLRIDDATDPAAPLRRLIEADGGHFVAPEHPHCVIERAGGRLKWEQHSEFTSYTLIRPLPATTGGAAAVQLHSAFALVPADWLATLPGQTIAAIDVTILPAAAAPGATAELAALFEGNTLVGAEVSDGAALAVSDFMLTDDGRSRWLVIDQGMTPGQRARVAQRLIDIGIYRVMAMLAFPVARSLGGELARAEQRLSAITARIAELGAQVAPAEVEREERLALQDLTQLAAEMEKEVASTAFRFAASNAYWDIVKKRVGELREQRRAGVQTIGEFLARRLEPAISTVQATARRQQELSARIARASELLRTRVDVAREEQNQRLLVAMERRGKLSLRLQQTVEGLSVAAITYYAIGLLGYLAKPLKDLWPALDPDWVSAAAIPLVAFAVWRSVRRIRRELGADPG